MLAPEGTAALAENLPSTKQSTSIVGRPLESRIIRARMSVTCPIMAQCGGHALSSFPRIMHSTNLATWRRLIAVRESLILSDSIFPSTTVLGMVKLRTTQLCTGPHHLESSTFDSHPRNNGLSSSGNGALRLFRDNTEQHFFPGKVVKNHRPHLFHVRGDLRGEASLRHLCCTNQTLPW
mgnify:FL=1